MMAKFSSSFLLNAALAATCLAAPGGRAVVKPQPGNAQLAVRDAAKKPTAKRKLGSGSSATLSKAPKQSASAQADVSLVAALQKQIDELTGALTSHAIKQIDAPARGKSVKHRAFIDMNGLGSVHLLGAEHGDIYSVNGEWNTIDTTWAKEIAERNPQVPRWYLTTMYPHAGRELALEYKFGMTKVPGFQAPIPRRMLAGFQQGTAATITAEQRALTEHHRLPGIRLFSAETGFTEVTVKRVGRVRTQSFFRDKNDSQAIAVTKGAKLKAMVAFVNLEDYSDSTFVEIDFQNAQDGSTTKVATIPYQAFKGLIWSAQASAPLPLIINAPAHGAYTFTIRSGTPKRFTYGALTSHDILNPHVVLRVEEVFEPQSDDQMAAELDSFRELFRLR